jgi:hypothetical protein
LFFIEHTHGIYHNSRDAVKENGSSAPAARQLSFPII